MQGESVQTIIVDGTGIGYRKKATLDERSTGEEGERGKVVVTKGKYKLVECIETGRCGMGGIRGKIMR